jgi:hypothetical protein
VGFNKWVTFKLNRKSKPHLASNAWSNPDRRRIFPAEKPMRKLRPETRFAESAGRPEEERLAIVDGIKARADTFAELSAVCPGCGRAIWEAKAGTLVYRGCGCMTFCYPPGHWLYEFNADKWAAAVALHCQSSSARTAPGIVFRAKLGINLDHCLR